MKCVNECARNTFISTKCEVLESNYEKERREKRNKEKLNRYE